MLCSWWNSKVFKTQDPKAKIFSMESERSREHSMVIILGEVSQLAYDVLWSDPACPALFNGTDNFPTGFCESHRGLLACENGLQT